MDIRQDELGDLVDKEMAATSAAIEEAVRRIDVSIVHLTVLWNIFLYMIFFIFNEQTYDFVQFFLL